MAKPLKVGIIGGGIGGVATAVALSQRGIDYHLFERAAEFGEVGAGIQMTPNAVKVIKAFGAWDALNKIGFLPEALVGRNWDTAEETFRMPLKSDCPRLYGAEFFHVHRADLHHLLADMVDRNKVTFSIRCTGVSQTGDKAVAHFDDGSTFEADLIIGADGVRSVVRHALFGDDDPKFTGHMCYRAVVPFDSPPNFVAPEASFWLGPNSHIVTYYVNSGKAVNIVAVHETEKWVEESWNARSTKEELLADFQGWHTNIQQLFDRVDDVYRWGLFDRDPMETWSKDRITLLGDAAHPMLPFLSQGAAMAIEDAYVLAKALAALPDQIPNALQQYEKERLPRTARVQLEARERGKTYHLSSKEAQAKRDAEYREQQKKDPHAGGIKANWVYAYNATDFEPVV
ncbi:FAD-dependent monooxygenase [Neopusillimonas maritima]|uniref:Salicylate 1-monooxygenase n=1 Tax=Neopusillimonas maritima TaxID=2026239 RepID=A0A3A1YUN2_9BURK|nr:FAD-dependent monooxygenase [Neopusillimonas maritima]RIY41265.1 salicylate 1-monooxygenase [Neopusillimonas maritima]